MQFLKLGDPFLQPDVWLPAQQLFGFGIVSKRDEGVAGAGRNVSYLPADHVRHLFNGIVLSSPDIDNFTGRNPHPQSQNIRFHYVGDVREIPSNLAAVFHPRHWLAAQALPQKNPGDGRVSALRDLPRSVHVEIPEAHGRQIIQRAENLAVHLADQFLQRIWSFWPRGHVLAKRKLSLVPVRGRRSGIYHFFYAGLMPCPKHVKRAGNIHRVWRQRILDRWLDAGERSAVKDRINPREMRSNRLEVDDVALHEFCRFINILLLTSREIVQNYHLITFADQSIRDMRPDKSRSAGN